MRALFSRIASGLSLGIVAVAPRIGKQAGRACRLGVSSSVRRAGRPRGSRGVPGGVVSSSSSHPRQASKEAEERRSRGIGGGLLFQAAGKRWHDVIPSDSVPPFRRGGNDTRGGRHALIILTAASPSVPRFIPIPIPKKQEQQASRQGHGGTVSTIVSRRAMRTSKQDENSERTSPIRIIPRPTTIPRVPSHAPSTQSPRLTTSKTRRGRNESNGTRTMTTWQASRST